MKKITESQLIEQARGLRAYMSEADPAAPAPVAPAASTNPWEGKDPVKAAAWAKLSPQVQKKLGGADPTDPYIIARMTKGELGGIFGGGATDANPDGTAKAATIPVKANAAADQATTADLAQLKTLIAQLSSMASQGAKTPATATSTDKRTPAEIKASADLGNFSGESVNESTTYFLKKLRLLEDAPQTAVMPAAPAGDKAAIVQQIQAIMAKINANNENPSPEIIAALGDAQKAIDTANTPTTPPVAPPNQSAKVPPKAWAKGVLGAGSKGPEVSALQKQLGIPETGVFDAATKAAVIKKQTELKVKPDGAWGPASQAAMAAVKPPPVIPKEIPKEIPKTPEPVTDYSVGNPMESVTFGTEESLARIIDLARR